MKFPISKKKKRAESDCLSRVLGQEMKEHVKGPITSPGHWSVLFPPWHSLTVRWRAGDNWKIIDEIHVLWYHYNHHTDVSLSMWQSPRLPPSPPSSLLWSRKTTTIQGQLLKALRPLSSRRAWGGGGACSVVLSLGQDSIPSIATWIHSSPPSL